MIIKHTNIMFGVPCYLPDTERGAVKPAPLPICTVIASLDEGMTTEDISKEYNLSEEAMLSILDYIKENGNG